MSLLQIASVVGGVISALGLGAFGGFLFYKRKHPIEVSEAKVKIEAAELDNDKIKWDFQQKIIKEMHEELDKRDAECEKRINEVEQRLNGKVESIINEIHEKCINNCLAKEYNR